MVDTLDPLLRQVQKHSMHLFQTSDSAGADIWLLQFIEGAPVFFFHHSSPPTCWRSLQPFQDFFCSHGRVVSMGHNCSKFFMGSKILEIRPWCLLNSQNARDKHTTPGAQPIPACTKCGFLRQRPEWVPMSFGKTFINVSEKCPEKLLFNAKKREPPTHCNCTMNVHRCVCAAIMQAP